MPYSAGDMALVKDIIPRVKGYIPEATYLDTWLIGLWTKARAAARLGFPGDFIRLQCEHVGIKKKRERFEVWSRLIMIDKEIAWWRSTAHSNLPWQVRLVLATEAIAYG